MSRNKLYEVLPKSSRNFNAARKLLLVQFAPLDIASSTLCESLCQAAFCCEEACVFSVHFCDVLLVLLCDRTDLLK